MELPLEAPHLLGQPTIRGSLLCLHSPPRIPVMLQVLHVCLLPFDAGTQLPRRARRPACCGTFRPPHVQGGNEEKEESGGQQVGADAVLAMQEIGKRGHRADHAQNAAHHPREQATRDAPGSRDRCAES
jgi:hypothetical protein